MLYKFIQKHHYVNYFYLVTHYWLGHHNTKSLKKHSTQKKTELNNNSPLRKETINIVLCLFKEKTQLQQCVL